jgi:hypothetical protein
MPIKTNEHFLVISMYGLIGISALKSDIMGDDLTVKPLPPHLILSGPTVDFRLLDQKSDENPRMRMTFNSNLPPKRAHA